MYVKKPKIAKVSARAGPGRPSTIRRISNTSFTIGPWRLYDVHILDILDDKRLSSLNTWGWLGLLLHLLIVVGWLQPLTSLRRTSPNLLLGLLRGIAEHGQNITCLGVCII